MPTLHGVIAASRHIEASGTQSLLCSVLSAARADILKANRDCIRAAVCGGDALSDADFQERLRLFPAAQRCALLLIFTIYPIYLFNLPVYSYIKSIDICFL